MSTEANTLDISPSVGKGKPYHSFSTSVNQLPDILSDLTYKLSWLVPSYQCNLHKNSWAKDEILSGIISGWHNKECLIDKCALSDTTWYIKNSKQSKIPLVLYIPANKDQKNPKVGYFTEIPNKLLLKKHENNDHSLMVKTYEQIPSTGSCVFIHESLSPSHLIWCFPTGKENQNLSQQISVWKDFAHLAGDIVISKYNLSGNFVDVDRSLHLRLNHMFLNEKLMGYNPDILSHTKCNIM